MKHPIVILHGWGLSATLFEPVARKLRTRGYRVFVPDFPGFGSAKIPQKPLFLKDYVEFLSEYLKKKKIRSPVIIAHSFGGRVALKYTEHYPGDVHALILTGAPGYTPVPKKRLMLFIALAKIGKLFFLVPFFHFFKERVRSWYYFVVGARDYYKAEGVMRDTFKHIVQEELVTSMSAIRVPTLLVWGEADNIIPVGIAQKMKETMSNAELRIVPHVGHALPYRNPHLFISTVLPWLENV